MNNMLSVEEVKNFLESDQKRLEDLIKQGKLHAYKIGGTYLRFRKEEVLNLRSEAAKKNPKAKNPGAFLSKLYDFWRFNNFYIVSLLIVGALTFLVFRS